MTTLELKSGYGLELESERRALQAVRQLPTRFPVTTVATFLGAHAVPPEFAGDSEGYIDACIDMMGTLHEEGLIDCVDAFCENIAFSPEQVLCSCVTLRFGTVLLRMLMKLYADAPAPTHSIRPHPFLPFLQTRRLFERAIELGLPVRLHGDQLSDQGCGALAADMGALSCDHCEYTSDASAEAMGRKGTVAVLLAGSNFYINEVKKPPVEKFRGNFLKRSNPYPTA